MSVTIINVTSKSEVTINKKLSLGSGASDSVTDSGVNTTLQKLTSTSTPPVSEQSAFSQALSSGSATIDLTNLKDDQGNTIATTGLRVQIIKVQNPNPNQLAVAASMSNGYALTFTVPPNAELHIHSTAGGSLGVIGSSAKSLTLTGTGSQASTWMIVLG